MLVPIHQTTSRHIPQISHNNVILLLVLNVVLQKYLYHVHDKKKTISVPETVCIPSRIIHSLESQFSFQQSSCYYCIH